MSRLLVAALLLLPALARGQNLPYSVKKGADGALSAPAIQEDLEYLYNQVHQQKVVTSNLTANGVVTSVGATSPICSSGGTVPSISLCGNVSGSVISGNISGSAGNVTGTVGVSNGGTGATTASGALTNLGAFPAAGGTITGQTTVAGSTLTVTGQDANGYSVKVASGIDAGVGCINLQGGLTCGPVQGSKGDTGATGATGAQGPAGQNGLLTFASDIAAYWIITSTSQKQNYALTVATDGVLVVTSTTTTAFFLNYQSVNKKYLSNGAFTSRITVDDSDGVLRMTPNTVTLRMTDLAVYDTNGNVWDIGMDTDGVIKTTFAGAL